MTQAQIDQLTAFHRVSAEAAEAAGNFKDAALHYYAIAMLSE